MKFAESPLLESLASQLFGLLDRFRSSPNIPVSLLTIQSVAKWIYLSNNIEDIKISEGDTLKFLTSLTSASAVEALPVTQTFSLLQQTYSPSDSVRTFTGDCFRRWHKILFSYLPNFTPGDYRRRMAWTKAPEYHVYPHHTAVSGSISRLILFLSSIAKDLESNFTENSPRKILFYFAYAAFAQFHFVDIHPFVDGNGRMCRFISKYILDPICPLPIPMFEDRDKYVNALHEGRKENPDSAPVRLLHLLLKSACEFYEEILAQFENYENLVYVYFMESDDETDLERILLAYDESCRERLRDVMIKMELGVTRVNIGEIAYVVTKLDLVDKSTL